MRQLIHSGDYTRKHTHTRTRSIVLVEWILFGKHTVELSLTHSLSVCAVRVNIKRAPKIDDSGARQAAPPLPSAPQYKLKRQRIPAHIYFAPTSSRGCACVRMYANWTAYIVGRYNIIAFL